jgi:hypothetical protein
MSAYKPDPEPWSYKPDPVPWAYKPDPFPWSYISQIPWQIGWSADPDISILFDKSTIAQIKVKELDYRISQLQQAIDMTKMMRDTLAKQYKI